MLGADAFNLVVAIAESGLIDTAVNDLVARSQVMMMAENRGVGTSVKNHLIKWRTSVRRRMTKVCETERFQRELALYQEVIHWDEETFFYASSRRGEETGMGLRILFRSAPLARKREAAS